MRSLHLGYIYVVHCRRPKESGFSQQIYLFGVRRRFNASLKSTVSFARPQAHSLQACRKLSPPSS
jgi:hypothetical protein